MARWRDIEFAEDILQDAVASALENWPINGVPHAPRAWLMRAAQNQAIDQYRRARTLSGIQLEYVAHLETERASNAEANEDSEGDERLRMLFTCCHPALHRSAQIALTLRTLGGMTTNEIARAFLTSEQTMAQRLVRAKRKIKLAGIPYSIPEQELWPERLNSVLAVLYLIFNEGYAASSGERIVRSPLCYEAIRLARILQMLMPNEPEVLGLLALMLLHDSRRTARQGPGGEIISLENQDRTLWKKEQINHGTFILKRALGMAKVGAYQLQAAISAVHADSTSFKSTDWREITLLYERLYQIEASPVVRLNWAVALSYASSAKVGLEALLQIEPEIMDQYQPFHAARADLLRRCGKVSDAGQAYERALQLTENLAERAFLQSRLELLSSG